MDNFIMEYEETLSHFDDPEYFDVSPTYSAVYHRFLDLDLSDRPAIRGQLEGPVSFGFNALDQDERPILFDDNVRHPSKVLYTFLDHYPFVEAFCQKTVKYFWVHMKDASN